MTNQELYKKVDHTLLRVDATEMEIHEAISHAHLWGCRSVCIPPAYVSSAMFYRQDIQVDIPIVAVAGFPFGYQSNRVKWTEIKELHQVGVDEIDIVAPLYLVKSQNWDAVDSEIGMYKVAADGTAIKVIIESGLLDEDEIKRYCEIFNKHEVDFVKTSSGFTAKGATVEAVKLLRQELNTSIKIKASGGIRSKADMLRFIEAGADVLGMSKVREALEGGNKNV